MYLARRGGGPLFTTTTSGPSTFSWNHPGGEGIAATVLNNLGLDLDTIRQSIENMVPTSGGTLTIGEIPFTPGRSARPGAFRGGGAPFGPTTSALGASCLFGADPRGRGRRARACCMELGSDRSASAKRRASCLGGALRPAQLSERREEELTPRRWTSSAATSPQLAIEGKLDPGHRAREGDRARHPGPLPPQEEQPGAHRRAGRRQDRASSRAWRSASSTTRSPEPLKDKRLRHAGSRVDGRRARSIAVSSRSA